MSAAVARSAAGWYTLWAPEENNGG